MSEDVQALAKESTSASGLVSSQGALLFGAFAIAQGLSFGRNAILGHWLAKGDFGIAATLTLILQLVETLSDLGADRLIIQARDGDAPRFVATQHLALIFRGVVTALVIFILAEPAAHFFGVPEASTAFTAVALVPLIKGFQHLDLRRAQRRFDNRPFAATEVAPQALALAVTVPALYVFGDYRAVIWISFAQAGAFLAVSHIVAERPYRLACDRDALVRLINFGWPIWLSAFPLVAVYQGDRIVVGHLIGMEALAAYTAAFMMAMVPGVIAAKVGHALMLPVFSRARDDRESFAAHFNSACEATVFAASVFLAGFIILGGPVLGLAFGPNYAGYGNLAAWLALMWGIRMIQAVPGMALMAEGETRPFLVAGFVRAAALIPAFVAALNGFGLEVIAACGVLGELASLIYVTFRVDRLRAGLGVELAQRALLLAPVAGLALVFAALSVAPGPIAQVLATILAVALIAGLFIVRLPANDRRAVLRIVGHSFTAPFGARR
ncbi:MAG: oligosaccharide flippase family protein [Hyphomicrobium sp.]|nr:oligosaccharide flippase family protein [Hyphomicrobium sp.]